MTTTEYPRCKECGAIFDTVEDLIEHQKTEAEDKILRKKRYADDWHALSKLIIILING